MISCLQHEHAYAQSNSFEDDGGYLIMNRMMHMSKVFKWCYRPSSTSLPQKWSVLIK
jgi:hypothetical protein